MGMYINPSNCSKEQFLVDYGIETTMEEVRDFDYMTASINLPVLLVDNDPFTAAAVAYDANERDSFLHGILNGRDRRPVKYYLVPKAALTGNVR